MKYDDIIGSTNALFSVSKKHIEVPLGRSEFYITLTVIIIIIFSLIFYIEHRRAKQLSGVIKRVTKKDSIDKALIKRRLK